MNISTELINLPKIGNRSYVHSTTFIKFLISKFPNVSQVLIKFSDVAIATEYEFILHNNVEKKYKFCTHGFIRDTTGVIKFGFIQHSLNNQQSINTNHTYEPNLKCNSMDSLIDTVVLHSKSLCTDLYNKDTDVIYMASVELCNVSNIIWPIDLNYTMTESGNRITVTYANKECKIAKLFGIIKEK